MMKKNGFISISIIYSFFLVFLLMLVLVMASYINTRTRLNIYKKDIKESAVKTTKKTLETYIKGNVSRSDIVKDAANNYYFIGAAPDNYIRFNDETWRIIGLVQVSYCADDEEDCTDDYLIKLIRNESLGTMPWDYKMEGVGSSSSSDGSNDWQDSQLMMLLNPSQYLPANRYEFDNYNVVYTALNGDEINIYRYMGTYFNEEWIALKPTLTNQNGFTNAEEVSICDDETTSFCMKKLSLVSQARIAEVSWNIKNNVNELTSSWQGKIALPSQDDFIKATSKSGCGTNWVADCYDKNWLAKLGNIWTLNAGANVSDKVVYISENGFTDANTSSSYDVRPVLYLKPNQQIQRGNGKKTNPFVIE